MDKEESRWLHDGLPTAALIFWSVVGRIVAAVALICCKKDKKPSKANSR